MSEYKFITSKDALDGMEQVTLEASNPSAEVVQKVEEDGIVKGATVTAKVKITTKHNSLLKMFPAVSADIIKFFNDEIKQATPSAIGRVLGEENLAHRMVHPLDLKGDEWHGKKYTVVMVPIKKKSLDGTEYTREEPRGFGGQPRWLNKEVQELKNLVQHIVQQDGLGINAMSFVKQCERNGMSFTSAEITRQSAVLKGSRPRAVAKALREDKIIEQGAIKQDEAAKAIEEAKAVAVGAK